MNNERRNIPRIDVLDEETKMRLDRLMLKFMSDWEALEAQYEAGVKEIEGE